jgi:hypothetical protein
MARYCAPACQKSDGSTHKQVCTFSKALRSVAKGVAKPWSCHEALDGHDFAADSLGCLRSRRGAEAFGGSPFAFTRLQDTSVKKRMWQQRLLLWAKAQWCLWMPLNRDKLVVLAELLHGDPDAAASATAVLNQTITEVHRRWAPTDFSKTDIRVLYAAADAFGMAVQIFTELTKDQVRQVRQTNGHGDTNLYQCGHTLYPSTGIPEHLRKGVSAVIQLGLAPVADCWQLRDGVWARKQ